jgi:two-component system, OmpR family, sensor kinase
MIRLPIHLRLALVSAGLAAGVLAAGLLTVYLIEAHQVHQALVADARTAARDLALAGEHPAKSGRAAGASVSEAPATHRNQTRRSGGGSTGLIIPPPVTGSDSSSESDSSARTPPAGGSRSDGEDRGGGSGPGGGVSDSPAGPGPSDVAFVRRTEAPTGGPDGREETAMKVYLGARSGSSNLLVYRPLHGRALYNRRLAARLAARGPSRAGVVRTVAIDGDGYVVATAARGTGLVMAGLPIAEADAAVRRLLDAMLIVGAIGLVPATAAAWWAARRALSPLSRIAQRASRVTAGDLSVRMGPVATQDEIGDVATAIDAMLDRLEAAFAAQRRFVHDASHELRTPLTIARGHLEVAFLGDDAPAELRQAVAVSIAELDRMGRLVDSLLRLARAGEGGGGRRPLDLSALTQAAVDRCRVLGDRSWRIDGARGAYVEGDEGALEQVLLNLLSNAVRHTAPGDDITVATAVDGGLVRVEVCDSGEGIDPELLPTLFDRFTRADSARSRDTGGAGLGLAICHAIVTAHGGTITARSRPGEGAAFLISLPRTVAAPEGGGMRAVSPPAHV